MNWRLYVLTAARHALAWAAAAALAALAKKLGADVPVEEQGLALLAGFGWIYSAVEKGLKALFPPSYEPMKTLQIPAGRTAEDLRRPESRRKL